MDLCKFGNSLGHRRFRVALSLGTLIGIGTLTACQTQRIEHHEDNLAAAGFIVKPANSPERQSMLKRLPANRFVQRVKGDVVHYVYADPLVCGCLYVGTQQAYDQYKRDQKDKQLADEQSMTAQSYADEAWNWNAWGPWTPSYGFGYGAGYGW